MVELTHEKRLSVITWNVEWRQRSSKAADIIRERIWAHDPDVICLTETPADFLASGGHIIEGRADWGYPMKGNRRKVLLWSKQPWTNVNQVGHPDLPPGRFVSGQTSTSIGEVAVVGVCIPWSGAHVTTGRRDRKRWDDHLTYLKYLSGVLEKVAQPAIVLGDFNQAIPRRTAPVDAFRALEAAVCGRFDVATSGCIEPIGGFAIDHVAHSRDLRSGGVVGLSATGPTGEKLSDHFGLAISLSAVSF